MRDIGCRKTEALLSRSLERVRQSKIGLVERWSIPPARGFDRGDTLGGGVDAGRQPAMLTLGKIADHPSKRYALC